MSRNAILLSILGAVVLVAAAWVFIYTPQNDTIEDLESQTAAQEQQATTLRTQIATLEAVRASAPEIEARIAEVEAIIPSDAAFASALRQLQAAADDAGVTLRTVTPTRPTNVGNPGSPQLHVIPVGITLQGSYFQAVDFLRRLEDPTITARGLLVNSVSVTGSAYPTLEISINASMFATLDEVPVPAADAPPAPDPTETPTDGATDEEDGA